MSCSSLCRRHIRLPGLTHFQPLATSASDVNGDGKLDLLVGDGVNLCQRAAGVSEETYGQRETQWQADYEALQKLPSESRHKKTSALWQRRSTCLQDESTGFVWLYLRK
jgi:hypothetical protein